MRCGRTVTAIVVVVVVVVVIVIGSGSGSGSGCDSIVTARVIAVAVVGNDVIVNSIVE